MTTDLIYQNVLVGQYSEYSSKQIQIQSYLHTYNYMQIKSTRLHFINHRLFIQASLCWWWWFHTNFVCLQIAQLLVVYIYISQIELGDTWRGRKTVSDLLLALNCHLASTSFIHTSLPYGLSWQNSGCEYTFKQMNIAKTVITYFQVNWNYDVNASIVCFYENGYIIHV